MCMGGWRRGGHKRNQREGKEKTRKKVGGGDTGTGARGTGHGDGYGIGGKVQERGSLARCFVYLFPSPFWGFGGGGMISGRSLYCIVLYYYYYYYYFDYYYYLDYFCNSQDALGQGLVGTDMGKK